MRMYDLSELISNYADTTGSLFYSKDEATNSNADIKDTNNSKSFKYKTKLLQSTIAAAEFQKTQQSLYH